MYYKFSDELLNTLDIKGFVIEYFYKAATLILVSAVILVSCMSVTIFADVYSNNKSITAARSLWSASGTFNEEGKLTDIVKLKGLNNNISGWISIPGTEINNPICNYAENDYYKSHNYLGKDSNYGSLYFAKEMNLSEPYVNTVIYGNSPHDGSMFSDLVKYRDKFFTIDSQIITFATEYSISDYQIFAVILTTDNPAHDTKGTYFDYAKTEFYGEMDFDIWISEAKLRSLYDTSISVNHDDSIITLVTDTDDFSSSKLVVMAKKITEDDLAQGNTLKVNSSPKFPAAWYILHGISNPYVFNANID
jgi:sortase B